MKQNTILILGMHRSGTSALTRVLNLWGVDLSKEFSSPNDFNERGYWESPIVQEINDKVLSAANSAWFDMYMWQTENLSGPETEGFIQNILDFLEENFGSTEAFAFGIKDPRICRFASLWLSALNRFGSTVSIILPFRNPMEVAKSLEKRDGLDRKSAFFIWLRHVLDAEQFSREYARVFVSYEGLLGNWQTELATIKANLALDWPCLDSSIIKEIDGFLSESLHHHKFHISDLEAEVGSASLVYRTYQLLNSARVRDSKEIRLKFRQLRHEFNAIELESTPVIEDHIEKYLRSRMHCLLNSEQIADVMADRFSLRESMLKQIAKKKDLEVEIASKAAVIEELDKAAESLAESNNHRKELIESLKRNVDLKEGEVKRSLASIEQSQQIIRDMEDQNSQLRESLASHLQDKQLLQDKRRTLESRVAEETVRIRSLKQELNKVSGEINSLGTLAGLFSRRLRQLLSFKLLRRRYRRITVNSGIFDEDWYLKKNPDVRDVKDPLMHYLAHGGFEGRDPGPYFDSSWYLKSNPEVLKEKMNPLIHYLYHGIVEGRDPNPYFSTDWYVDRNPDIKDKGLTPLKHFIDFGDQEGNSPSPLFDSEWYLKINSDVARAKIPPFFHFQTYGRREGRSAKETGATNSQHLFGISVRFYPGKNVFRREVVGTSACDIRQNILVVTHTAGARLYGAERSFLDVCGALDPTRFNVFAVVPTENVDYINALSALTDGVYLFAYKWWRKGVEINSSTIQVFASLMSKHHIDLLYGNTIMLREPFLAAKEKKVTSILHAREIIDKDEHLRGVIGLGTNEIVADVSSRTDFIIGNSKATVSAFECPERTKLLYNTVRSMDFVNLVNEPGEHLYVGLVSSNIKKKGLGDFIKLARLARSKLPQVVFRVIGPDTEFSQQVQKTLSNEANTANLEFCGYIRSPVNAMSKLNVLVNFSSFAESFGRTVAEAMMAGRPVIVYDYGALPELVEHERSGFIIPNGEYESALPFLEKLSNQYKLIEEMGAIGRRRAMALFDTPAFRSGLQKIISDVLVSSTQQDSKPDDHKGSEANKLKVAYFLWHFPVPSETFVLNELRHLVELGHDVLVFCKQSPHKGFIPDFEITWQRVATPDELAHHLVRTKRTLVHSHFVYPTVSDFLWPACEKAEIEFTFIAHAQDIFRHENDQKNRIGEVSRSRWCKRVLVPGRFHREYLLERGVQEDKIYINPQGIDPSLYPFHGGTDNQAGRSISCIQRFVEKKGIEDLIKASPALVKYGVQVDIYGYGPLEDCYRQLKEDLNAENVTFHGMINTRQELIKAIVSSDLFVTPCIRAQDGDMDGIPTVFMESMALGIPVVTTDVSSIPDLIEDGINGLICEAHNPDSVAATISRYFEMPQARKHAMRRAARNKIESEFNTEKLLHRLVDLYLQRTVDIIIVSWNNLPELKEVIRRIFKFTGMSFRLVITDNNSKKPIQDYLQDLEQSHERVKVLWQDENLFVGPGTNKALEATESEYAIYVCGKECFALRHNWERKLIEHMDAHPELGLAGTLGYSPSYLTGKGYQSIPLFPEFRNPRFSIENPDREFRHVQGGLFVIRRQMYEEIGGFSDAVPHDYTDVEYSYYVESCGWELGQVPGILAMYNKTRPGIYSRLMEDVHVLHPAVLDEVSKIEAIANGVGALCNICEWYGGKFESAPDQTICPDCGSSRADRSVWRFLAESILTHRRLAGLYISPNKSLSGVWVKQFRGSIFDLKQLSDIRSLNGMIDFREDQLEIVYLDEALTKDDNWLLAEIWRVLAPGATLLVRQPFGESSEGGFKTLGGVKDYLGNCGFNSVVETAYTSEVVQYDWLPLLVCEK